MHMHISGEETAWTDVLREIAIMKQLDHPNLVSLQEVSLFKRKHLGVKVQNWNFPYNAAVLCITS